MTEKTPSKRSEEHRRMLAQMLREYPEIAEAVRILRMERIRRVRASRIRTTVGTSST